VEYRRAVTAEEKAAIFRMRHEAYTSNGTIAPRPSGLFHDKFDESPNAWLIAVFIDGELASSIRIHISAAMSAPLPAMLPFGDVITPHLEAGECLIDASKHVNRLEFSRRYPEMPLITMRPGFLAEQYFNADFITGACRADNQGAFRRMLAVTRWAAPREYPNLDGGWALMAYDCHALRAKTHARYPFYVSTLDEQRRLFGDSSNPTGDIQHAIGRRKIREAAET